jgi:hypothetical protein
MIGREVFLKRKEANQPSIFISANDSLSIQESILENTGCKNWLIFQTACESLASQNKTVIIYLISYKIGFVDFR